MFVGGLQPEEKNESVGEAEEKNDLSPPRLRSTSSLVDEDSFIREAMEGCRFTTIMQKCAEASDPRAQIRRHISGDAVDEAERIVAEWGHPHAR